VNTTPRLSPKEREVVALLASEHTELYGLQIVDRSAGRISRGSVYVILGRLKERGMVESRVEPDAKIPGLPRQLYRVTTLGKRTLKLYEQLEALR
jgi:DNA-binding PadR family transcriptional regulator